MKSITPFHAIELYRSGRYAELESLLTAPGYNGPMNLFLYQMKVGRGENGWNNLAMCRAHLDNEWMGESLEGKVIQVQRQEGIGDVIMYARYIPYLLERAKEVWMYTDGGLEDLFLESFPGLKWGSAENPDYRIGSTIARWAKAVPAPYLKAAGPQSPNLGGPLRVGLTWKGNPEFPFDRERSLEWSDFKPLLKCRAQFFALQFDDQTPTGLPNMAARCTNFLDTAHAIKDLDLIITTCTAMPNLAGALGYPKVWVILRDPIDCRWGVPEERSDWYPGIRQFRNVSMNAVREALEQLIASRECEPLSVASY